MESDSTLLDEDDSILQATPTRISPIGCSGNQKDSMNDCSSSKGASNKENMSINKCEGQKLNVEPLQMKKKKKSGGFNLRKSLAWNRAFFTEEGVLDPLELSMISGADISSSREGLSTINEDDSLSNDCQSYTESADLQALENNLFKEVPVVSLKSNKVHLPPKHSPARVSGASSPLVSAKGLPTCRATRTVSRGGSCTRPLPSSSLKRPANVSTSQAVTKESKLPRIPSSRPGHPSTLLKNRSATGNIKHKQITQPAVIIANQRNNAPKSSLKSVKSKADPGPWSVKASISHSKKTVQQAITSSMQLNSQARNKVTDTVPKLIPDHVASSIARPPPECLDGPSKFMASIAHATSTTSSAKPQKQFLPMKPSGLRMPSPSLGFFGQPKASIPHCAPQKAMKNPGYSKPPLHTPVRVADVNYSIATFETVLLRSKSDSQDVSHGRIKQNVGENSVKELIFSNEDEPSEHVNDADAISSDLDCNVLGCTESRMSTCIDVEKHDLSPQQNSSKCAKAVSRTRNSTDPSLSCLEDLHHVPEEQGNILFESSSGKPARLSCGNDHLLGEKSSNSKDSHNHLSETVENTDFETPAFIKNEEKSLGSSTPERCEESEKPLLEDDTEALPGTLLDVDRTGEISEEPVELQNESFDERTIVGKAIENNSIQSSVECTSLVRRHNYSDAENVGSDIICSSAITSSHSHSTTAGNCVLDGQVNNKGRTVEDPEGLTSVGTSLESQRADNRCGYVLAENILHGKQQSYSLQNIRETDPIVYDSSMIPLEISETPVRNARQIDERVEEEISSSIPLQVKTKLVQNPSCNVPVESCIEHMQLVSDGQVNNKGRTVEDPEGLTSVGTSLESQRADNRCGYVLAKNILHGKQQSYSLQNIQETDPIVYDSSMIPLEISETPVKNARQIDERVEEEISSSIPLQVKTKLVQNPSCNVPVESCIEHMQLVSDGQVNNKGRTVEDPEGLTSVGTSLESQRADNRCGYVLAENILHGKQQSYSLQNIRETDPIVYDSSMIPLEISETPVKNARQIDERVEEEISSSIPLQVETKLVQNPSCNVPVESCIEHMQLVSDQYIASVASEISDEAGLSNLHASVEKVPQADRSSIPDSLSSRERTIVAEVGSTVFEEGMDAGSETISIQVCSIPPQIHVNGDSKDIGNSDSNVVHILPVCAEVEPSSENCRPLAGSRMNHDVKHEEKRVLSDERKANGGQDIDTGTEESHNVLDAGTCLVKDKDAISPINRSHSSSSTASARIILPTNAVPFSDEWLAAMEAAGEDILKIKSGAVQNSPTEKPMPEPSPWSPGGGSDHHHHHHHHHPQRD